MEVVEIGTEIKVSGAGMIAEVKETMDRDLKVMTTGETTILTIIEINIQTLGIITKETETGLQAKEISCCLICTHAFTLST